VKKVIAFDLDGTIAPSKSPMTDHMSEQLVNLLSKFQVCIISGGKFSQFEKQLLSNLRVSSDLLKNLHLMPTCGTRYYVYDKKKHSWREVYAENFEEDEKKKIIWALDKGFDDLGYREKKTWGECIEDRESQITFSALGQDIVDELGLEGVRFKEEWDSTDEKKQKLRDYIAELIPEIEIRVGGVTSIDVTKQGIDKAYGMSKLMEVLKVTKKDILFIGDRIREGGNDYPVKLIGIDCIQISNWKETAVAIEAIMHVV